MSPPRLALICLCLAPLTSPAAPPGQVHFSGHIISPACLITPQCNRIDVLCQHRLPEQAALTDSPPRHAMPDDRGGVSPHWRDAQHNEADIIIRYRQGKKSAVKGRRMQDAKGNVVGGFSARQQ